MTTRRGYEFTQGTLPLLNEPIVNEDGTMAESLRLFLEGVQQRLGGPGIDALFAVDTDLSEAEDGISEAVSDGVLNPAEKLSIIPLISSIQAEEAALVAAAEKIGLSTTAYGAAQDAFAALLATLTTPVAWNSRTGDTTIPDPGDFSAKWDAVLDEAATLRSLIESSIGDAILDGVLTPSEKRSVVPQIQALIDERTDIVAVASALSQSSTAYTSAHDTFTTYLATLDTPVDWDDRNGTTLISVPQSFVDNWQALVVARDALRSDASTNLADAVNDGVLTVAEKRIIVPQIKALQAEETELVSSAANRNVSSTAYEGKQDDLTTYLATLTSPVAWDNFTGRTTIAAPATFNTRFQDTVEARDALRSAIEAADIRTGNIAANAVSDIVAENTASSAITTTNPKRSNSLTVTETADLTNFENGATVIVLVDFEHTIDLGAYDWCVMRLDLKRAKRTGGGSSTRRVWRWVEAGSSANSQFPAALETNDQTVTEPFNAVYADTLPASGDADFDATGYTYTVDIYVTDEWDDGSTMIDGYDSPSTNAKHHRIEDLNLILMHLRR